MDSCNLTLTTPKRKNAEASNDPSSPAVDNIRKRKSPATKLTPRKRASKSNTPKKNSTPKKNGSVVASCVLTQKIDLWREAKLSAEEDARMYAGRKIHPFFSLWKVEREKQLQDRVDKRKGEKIACGPIHVFENVEDDASLCDWSNWTFLDKMTTCADSGTESSDFMENSVESLNFDHICPSEPEDTKEDLNLEVNENMFSSRHTGILRKSDSEPQSKFLQESMRSYYQSCETKAESILWIHKYKPTKAFEVCGNEEAINLLCNWLHLWHEKHYQCRRDTSEDINEEEDSLHKVLYITGPTGHELVMLQSGKSAAVYACAQEQGFEVLEINASNCRNGAAIKENYESALEAHQFKRLLDHPKSSHKKTDKLLKAPALPNGIAAQEMDDGVTELIVISDHEAHNLGGTSPRVHGKNRRVQKVYGLLPFDLEAFHQIIPKILPWSYPSELSKLIEKEVAKSITILEENSWIQGLVNKKVYINERKNDLDAQSMMSDFLESKVDGIKGSLTDCSEFEKHSAIYKLSNCSGSLVTSSWQKDSSKFTLMSSMEKDPNNHSLLIPEEVYKRQSFERNGQYLCKFQPNQTYSTTHKSFDLSCSLGSMSGPAPSHCHASPSHCHASPVQVSLNNELTSITFDVCQSLDLEKLPQNPDSLTNPGISEHSSRATVQNIRVWNTETTTMSNVIDECSQTDFKLKSNLVESSPSKVMDVVQNFWKKLRICQKDLGQHTNPEQLGVMQVVTLTSELTNLMSEADLLFHNHQPKHCGIMEPTMLLSDEAMFSWYDEQTMMSTFAVHGFCFYAKRISDVGSKFGHENEVDLTSEILACTNNVMALGKLSRQNQTKIQSIHPKKQLEVNNPTNDTKRTSLSNAIRSIVPTRSLLAMKGLAFNEYISSLRRISILEGFRISNGSEKMRKRRRVAPHYLSRGRMSLSPEHISLVCEGDLYTKISSQYIASMESKV
ncbi:hypothetical protein VNO78_30913 [Psophocarpus tetragonolobus]|uniref:Uncharacterized protein n=1 Tax=Psophocarpus tetragonolobus TaxID=3891 RepID=A0AAN9X6I2_PSOTE